MKKVYLLPISLLMVLVVLTWGCEDDSVDDDVCLEAPAPEECPALSFSVCSDSNGDDYYEYNYQKYYCNDYSDQDEVDDNGDAIECSGAASEIVKDSGCATSSTSGVLLKSAMTSYTSYMLDAMNEVRALASEAAGCN